MTWMIQMKVMEREGKERRSVSLVRAATHFPAMICIGTGFLLLRRKMEDSIVSSSSVS